jgi:N utilization substance protein A
MVVSELRGEKIDIIPYNEEPARFVAKALSPARVREVVVDDEEKQATVIVPDDQLSLAIGRDGQNARLAARLTGWKVDIKSETEFAEVEGDIEYEGDEAADGRCGAVLTTGRRCPNAALQGSHYCGLPQHQSLARFQTSHVAVLNGVTEAEIAVLSDPEADAGAVTEIVQRAEAEFNEAEAAAAEAAAAEQAAAEAAEAEAAAAAAAEAEAAEAAAAEGEGDAEGEPGEATPEDTENLNDADEAAAQADADTEAEEELEDDEVEAVMEEDEEVGEATAADVSEAEAEGEDAVIGDEQPQEEIDEDADPGEMAEGAPEAGNAAEEATQ